MECTGNVGVDPALDIVDGIDVVRDSGDNFDVVVELEDRKNENLVLEDANSFALELTADVRNEVCKVDAVEMVVNAGDSIDEV